MNLTVFYKVHFVKKIPFIGGKIEKESAKEAKASIEETFLPLIKEHLTSNKFIARQAEPIKMPASRTPWGASALFSSDAQTAADAEDALIRRRRLEETDEDEEEKALSPTEHLRELSVSIQRENRSLRNTTRMQKNLVYLLIILNVAMIAEIVISIIWR